MSETVITSRDNPLVKRARAVRDGKIHELIFIEGVRLSEEAARSALSIQDVLYTERLADDERGKQLLQVLTMNSKRATLVSEKVLASVSDTKTPQGVVVLATRPAWDRGWEALDDVERNSSLPDASSQPSTPIPHPPLIVIMHRINNPSNAGAILRAAEAAGATGVLTTRGSADLFSPKALRGAMGSTFRLPLREGVRFDDALSWCAGRGIRTISMAAASSRTYTEIDWTGAHALILGGEGAGLEGDEIAAADEAVRIPMRAPVESLNVAVAAAIVLYEAARQRGSIEPDASKRGRGRSTK
ncbi:MAG TPA: RNA methyltransferase [Pyrinomonadaceae bacterium]|jgi:TrmH family RNA methyltransferase